jgi:hypothetical protein
MSTVSTKFLTYSSIVVLVNYPAQISFPGVFKFDFRAVFTIMWESGAVPVPDSYIGNPQGILPTVT